MTTLISSGTLYSDWHNTRKTFVSANSSKHSVHTEISTLAGEICQQQFLDSDELNWKPFTPENGYKDRASHLLSSVESEQLFTWDDSNICLYLDFWKAASKNTRFVLFYSSPEFELSNFINTHAFDEARIEKVINAWFARTRAMLTFFMNNRDRSLLVNVQSVSLASESFISAISQKFDLCLEPNTLFNTPMNGHLALTEYLSITLLLKNHQVSELYDEVRSVATVLREQDKSIPGIEDRSKLMINTFLDEVSAYRQLSDKQSELETTNKKLHDAQIVLEDDLSLYQLQIKQMREELETANTKRHDAQIELEDDVSLHQLQIKQTQEELEFYFNESVEQKKAADSVAEYLNKDPLLRIVHQVRQT